MMSENGGESMPSVGLSQLLLLTAIVGLILAMLQSLTHVPSGYGIEDFLAWVNQEAVEQMRALWQRTFERIAFPGLHWVPQLYLIIDTAIFVPLYSLLLLAIGDDLRYRLMRRLFLPWAPLRWLVRHQFAALIGVLMLVDYVENAAGLARLDALPLFFLGFIAQLLVARALLSPTSRYLPGSAAQWRRAWLRNKRRELAGMLSATLLLGALILGVAVVLQRAKFLPNPGCDAGSGLWAWGCYAHSFKSFLIALLVVDFMVLSGWLLYGPHSAQNNDSDIVAYRRALVTVVWRSRYVLLALSLVVVLLLVMDQGRDVIYAIAASPSNLDGRFSYLDLLRSAIVVALTNIALWTFGFACWLWTRCAVKVRSSAQAGCAVENPDIEIFARDWARGLGITPCLIAVLMCVTAMADAVGAAAAIDHANPGAILGLCAFVFVVLAGGVGFVFVRTRDDGETTGEHRDKYYDYATVLQAVRNPHYRLFAFITPIWLPIFALSLGLACRYLQLQSAAHEFGLPSLGLAIVLFELTFWLSLAGWLSLYEQSKSVPWVLIVLLVVGALGALGLTDNHVVAGAVGDAGLSPWRSGLLMFHQTLKTALIVGLALLWLLMALHSANAARLRLRWAIVVAVSVIAAMCWVINQAEREALATSAAAAITEEGPHIINASTGSRAISQDRIALPHAVADWLTQIARKTAPPAAGEVEQTLPVYFIAAEGGGIRSAYWTASVLAQLALQIPDFNESTFAMSGVSGGSVGIAVYRACSVGVFTAHETSVEECVKRFGRTDLLSPLLGAWFFEDVIARFVPQRCTVPGCGFLSRGLWFESAVLAALPGLSQGLLASRAELAKPAGKHVPYVLLNSTWVETGERAIASELAIGSTSFPTARDQLDYLGFEDLALVTAAHNSARFPFTNALGAVRNWRSHCAQEPPLVKTRRGNLAADDIRVICGHLADGGYFDNSAGHSIGDILREFARCRSGADSTCAELNKDMAAKKLHLRPVLFLIRNGVESERYVANTQTNKPSNTKLCAPVVQPAAADVRLRAPANSAAALARPRCAGTVSLFVDWLGPLIAALNSTGIGANGRMASALPSQIPLANGLEVVPLDLKPDGVLFPLGWHLSIAAQRGMKAQSESLNLKSFQR